MIDQAADGLQLSHFLHALAGLGIALIGAYILGDRQTIVDAIYRFRDWREARQDQAEFRAKHRKLRAAEAEVAAQFSAQRIEAEADWRELLQEAA